MNRTDVKLTLFSVGTLCIAFGAYHWYGVWGAVVALVLGGLAAWESMRMK